MAKHEPLFKIGDKYLYREQNLITVQIPIFFVCKDDEGQRYLVLLSDFYEDTYVICTVSNFDLYNMLVGNTIMRKPFLNASIIYFIKAASDLADDESTQVTYNDIKDILPEEGASFEINEDDTLKAYSSKLCFETAITIKKIKAFYCGYKPIQRHFTVAENYAGTLKTYGHMSQNIRFERRFFREQCTIN